MSRTHKTKPLWVKLRQGHIHKGEFHDHRKGYCDLPELIGVDYWRGGGRCHYTYEYTGKNFCCCSSCHGYEWETGAKAKARRQLRRWDEEYYSPDEEYAYEYQRAEENVEAAEVACEFCPACYKPA